MYLNLKRPVESKIKHEYYVSDGIGGRDIRIIIDWQPCCPKKMKS